MLGIVLIDNSTILSLQPLGSRKNDLLILRIEFDHTEIKRLIELERIRWIADVLEAKLRRRYESVDAAWQFDHNSLVEEADDLADGIGAFAECISERIPRI